MCYVPQKKAKNMQNSYLGRKSMFIIWVSRNESSLQIPFQFAIMKFTNVDCRGLSAMSEYKHLNFEAF